MADLVTSSPAVPDTLTQALTLSVEREVELIAKGYPEATVRVAISRAQGTAQAKVRAIRAGIRDEAFLDILTDELSRAEAWVKQAAAYFEGETTRPEGGD